MNTIQTDKYESAVRIVTIFLEDNEQYGDDWSKEKRELNDLLAEVKRLREQLGRYTQFVLWVEEEHNEVFDEYEGKDEL